MFDLAQAVQRWTQSAGTAQTRYTEGIQSTQVDPTQLAIAAQTKLLQGFNDAVQSGRWARNLATAGKSRWQQNSISKANNYSTGISAGAGAYQSAMATWGPIIDSAASQVASMPNNSFADSLARMNAFATALHNAKLQGA